MGIIVNVETESVRKAAENILLYGREAEHHTEEMAGIVGKIGSCWECGTASAVMKEMDRHAEQAKVIDDIMKQIGSIMEVQMDNYDNNEDNLKNAMGKIANMFR